jgi:predicted nucleotidyltransferase
MAKGPIPTSIAKLVQAYLLEVRKDIPIEKVILFGSFAKGKADKESDIDLFIVSSFFEKQIDKSWTLLLKKRSLFYSDPEYRSIEVIPVSSDQYASDQLSPLLAEIRMTGLEIA